ncbi:MAG: hypothetical protein IJS71_00540 [Clostridia bacterium]|nr:hypothetical protein [Clostridia bacterium]
MKKGFILFAAIFLLALCFALTLDAGADTGPHPYTHIDIVGDTEGMYMTLLSKDSYYGPYSAYDGKSEYELPEDPTADQIAEAKFIGYEDRDGYFYLRYMKSIGSNSFDWSYIPPSPFKILIYDSVNDVFITDNVIYEKQGFGSMYTVTLSDVGASVSEDPSVPAPERTITVEEVEYYTHHIVSFVVRLCICIGIEVLIALAFGFRGKELLPVVIANAVTQLALNGLLAIDILEGGFYANTIITNVYIPMEIAIIGIEFLAYFLIFRKFKFKRETNIKPVRILIYTVVANLVSFFGGFGIAALFRLIWGVYL